MVEMGGVLGLVSAALLFAALAAWLKLGRRPSLQRLDGRSSSGGDPVEIASRLLVLAVSLSAIAAAFAVVGALAG